MKRIIFILVLIAITFSISFTNTNIIQNRIDNSVVISSQNNCDYFNSVEGIELNNIEINSIKGDGWFGMFIGWNIGYFGSQLVSTYIFNTDSRTADGWALIGGITGGAIGFFVGP